MKTKETRTEVIKFRCTRDESEKIKNNAAKLNLSVSDYVRARSVKDYKTMSKKKDGLILDCLTKQDADLIKLYNFANSLNENSNKNNVLNSIKELRKENKELWRLFM